MLHETASPFPNAFALVILHVDPRELVEAAINHPSASTETRAVFSLTRGLIDAYDDPEALTEERLAEMAPLLRTVLDQEEPAASRDLQILWSFVDRYFEDESPARTLFADVVAERANERFASIVAGSVFSLGPH